MRVVSRPVGVGSGRPLQKILSSERNPQSGQRQALATARAVHLGARVLIRDEPTAAFDVAQSGLVLQ
jgi:ABC-type dipeptide/oligopeptide/nickel transport system ATPase subunit